MSKGGKLIEIQAQCPACGTTMAIRTTREQITFHKCTGCLYTLAMTDDYLMVVPTDYAEQLMDDSCAEPCGEIVLSDISTRYSGVRQVDDEYVEMVSHFLTTNPDLDPGDVVDFLNRIDDSHSDGKKDQ